MTFSWMVIAFLVLAFILALVILLVVTFRAPSLPETLQKAVGALLAILAGLVGGRALPNIRGTAALSINLDPVLNLQSQAVEVDFQGASPSPSSIEFLSVAVLTGVCLMLVAFLASRSQPHS